MTDTKVTDKREMRETTVLAPVAVTPAELLQMAVARGADIDKLEKLMELQLKWEANEARKAYMNAMAAFKASPPKLVKNKHVKFTTQKGVTEYDHATLDSIVEIVGAALSAQGLQHSWRTEQLDGGLIKVTCILTHILGHTESTSLQGGRDESGGKNNIQAVGSTVSYLQRYTLLAITGLATGDMDDDGKQSEPVERITPQQAADLYALIDQAGGFDEDALDRFLRYLKVDTIEEIGVAGYADACAQVRIVEKNRAARKAKVQK
ncbi:MAG: ERF family protein [Vulcanimicrobiaceae bacterium]